MKCFSYKLHSKDRSKIDHQWNISTKGGLGTLDMQIISTVFQRYSTTLSWRSCLTYLICIFLICKTGAKTVLNIQDL